MTKYAIVIVPERRPFKYRFLANLSLLFFGTGGVGGQFADDVGNAVPINRRDVAPYLVYEPGCIHPDMDFRIINMKEYLKSEGA